MGIVHEVGVNSLLTCGIVTQWRVVHLSSTRETFPYSGKLQKGSHTDRECDEEWKGPRI